MQRSTFFIALGRIFLTLSFFGLLGAWAAHLQDAPLFGMSEQHLFSDAIVLALLGIGSLVDGFIHILEGGDSGSIVFSKANPA